MKFSRAISRVKWLNGEKNQRLEDHLRPRPEGADMDILISTLMVFETLVFSRFNHLTQLIA
jgi:hypothetical protein